MPVIKIKRGIKSDFDTGVLSLVEGEPFFMTDTKQIGVAGSDVLLDYTLAKKNSAVYFQGSLLTFSSSNVYGVISESFSLGVTVGADYLSITEPGVYFVSLNQLITSTGSTVGVQIRKNGIVKYAAHSDNESTVDITVSGLLELVPTDIVQIYYSGTVTTFGSPNCSLILHKVS